MSGGADAASISWLAKGLRAPRASRTPISGRYDAHRRQRVRQDGSWALRSYLRNPWDKARRGAQLRPSSPLHAAGVGSSGVAGNRTEPERNALPRQAQGLRRSTRGLRAAKPATGALTGHFALRMSAYVSKNYPTIETGQSTRGRNFPDDIWRAWAEGARSVAQRGGSIRGVPCVPSSAARCQDNVQRSTECPFAYVAWRRRGAPFRRGLQRKDLARAIRSACPGNKGNATLIRSVLLCRRRPMQHLL